MCIYRQREEEEEEEEEEEKEEEGLGLLGEQKNHTPAGGIPGDGGGGFFSALRNTPHGLLAIHMCYVHGQISVDRIHRTARP